MGEEVEAYISREGGVDLDKVFDQYLRTAMVPVLEYRIEGDTLHYRWRDVVPGFDMPLRVTLEWPTLAVIRPTERWQRIAVRVPTPESFRVDENFYVIPRRVEGSAGR
jgi:aminopeptidase N